ncbi:hypothetical protein [Enterocloster lavalensis]|uniref:hypothetical protein n=1 Tax=Enterocloster lavalensis TaxID=460384 RepID=UPI002666921B|nr:hypothetical protein [Enterocloster lavalensis]
MPEIDLSWAITAVIAIVAFLSPIAVALINNFHTAKMKRLEFEHVEKLKQMEQLQQLTEKQFEIYYTDKKSAFSDFCQSAGVFSMGKQSNHDYEALHSALNRAMLFCNSNNQTDLRNFLAYVNQDVFGHGYSLSERESYSARLTDIILSLNAELESTKPFMY